MPQVEPREARGVFVRKSEKKNESRGAFVRPRNGTDSDIKTVKPKKVTVKKEAVPISTVRGKFWSHIVKNL